MADVSNRAKRMGGKVAFEAAREYIEDAVLPGLIGWFIGKRLVDKTKKKAEEASATVRTGLPGAEKLRKELFPQLLLSEREEARYIRIENKLEDHERVSLAPFLQALDANQRKEFMISVVEVAYNFDDRLDIDASVQLLNWLASCEYSEEFHAEGIRLNLFREKDDYALGRAKKAMQFLSGHWQSLSKKRNGRKRPSRLARALIRA